MIGLKRANSISLHSAIAVSFFGVVSMAPAAFAAQPMVGSCCAPPPGVTVLAPVVQGQWVDRQVVDPPRTVKRLRWVPAGWNVDPESGREYWRPGGLRLVRITQPSRVRTYRVWQPAGVSVAVPPPCDAPAAATIGPPPPTFAPVVSGP